MAKQDHIDVDKLLGEAHERQWRPLCEAQRLAIITAGALLDKIEKGHTVSRREMRGAILACASTEYLFAERTQKDTAWAKGLVAYVLASVGSARTVDGWLDYVTRAFTQQEPVKFHETVKDGR